MKRAVLGLMAAVAIAMPPSRAAADAPVKMLVSASTDGRGRLLPPSVETQALLRFLEVETGLRFEVEAYPWLRALKMAEKGEGLLYGASQTRERRQTLDFSEPMFKDSVWLVTRCDRSFDYQQLSQLDGLRVGVVRGTVNSSGFDAAAREGRFQVEFETGDSRARFEKLLLGRTHVLLMYSQWSAQEVDRAVQDRYGMLGAREAGAMQGKPCLLYTSPSPRD